MAGTRSGSTPRKKAPVKKAAAPKTEAPPKEEVVVEEVPVVEEVRPAVRFVANTHTTGTTTPSGATFSLSPGLAVKVSYIDAQALVAEGLGSIQGG